MYDNLILNIPINMNLFLSMLKKDAPPLFIGFLDYFTNVISFIFKK